MFLILFFMFCIFVFYVVYYVLFIFSRIVSPFVYSCLFSIFIQVYRTLPPGANPIAVNKYHIIYQYNTWCQA